MKKLALFLFMVYGAAAYSQNTLSTLAQVPPSYQVVALEGQDGSRYVYACALKNRRQPTVTDNFFSMEAQGESATHTPIVMDKDFLFLGWADNDAELVMYYAKDLEDENRIAVYVNLLSKAGNGEWHPTEIASFPYEKKERTTLQFASSPNGSKSVLVQSQTTGKESLFSGSKIIVFDSKGDILWENRFTLDFTDKTFYAFDAVVSDEGIVYLPVASHTSINRKTASDETFQIYEISENESNSYSESVAFGHITKGISLILQNGNIFTAGYYVKEINENEMGSYGIVFDPKTSSFAGGSHQDFPLDYKENKIASRVKGTLSNQEHNIYCKGLYEFSDGTVALLGEQQGVLQVQSQSGYMVSTSYKYFAKDIVFSSFSPTGSMETLKFFPKDQRSGESYFSRDVFDGYGLSYYPFFDNDQIHLVYADNMDNHGEKSGKPFNVKMQKKKSCATLLTLQASGEGNSRMIHRYKPSQKQIDKVLFLDDDGLVVLDHIKQEKMISKLKVSF